jgi:hypothetical protein
MGSYPSVLSIPSSKVAQDLQYLKTLFPDKFIVERTPDSDTVTLFDGKMTLILLSTVAAASTKTTAAALVMDESDIKALIKRQKRVQPSSKNSKKKKQFLTEHIPLPGGSVLVLVPPSMISSRTGRQSLTRILANYSNGSITNMTEHNGEGSIQFLTAEMNNISQSYHPQDDDQSSPPSANKNAEDVTHKDKLPSFPSLDFRLLQKNGKLEPNFPLNSRTGVPFDTDLFQGKVLFILRPPNNPAKEDPFWNERIFATKQRRVIVQVQGKFKRKPQGILYAGGEITDPMKLGLISKGYVHDNVVCLVVKNHSNC